MLKISIYNDNITHFSHWTRVSEDAEDVNNITNKVDFYGVYVYIKLCTLIVGIHLFSSAIGTFTNTDHILSYRKYQQVLYSRNIINNTLWSQYNKTRNY